VFNEEISLKTLLLGWGNPDRQDDGAAWHILAEMARRSGLSVPEELGESFELPDQPGELDLLFMLQLTPEIAETVSAYDRVAFIDAHTGSVEEDLNLRSLEAHFQTSPLTHHLTAESCLELAHALYHASPEAWLVSVRGYQFGFSRELSPATSVLVNEAAIRLTRWLQSGQFD
jgi:hydrogenase maturation protease